MEMKRLHRTHSGHTTHRETARPAAIAVNEIVWQNAFHCGANRVSCLPMALYIIAYNSTNLQFITLHGPNAKHRQTKC